MAEKKRLIRLDVYVKRNPELTIEEFHDKWSNGHGPLISEWLSRNGVIRYTQFHTPPEMAQVMLGVNHDSAEVLDFDGHGEFLIDSIETLQKLVQNPFYADKVKPDEGKLIDQSKTKRRIGYEEVWVRDGRPYDPRSR